MNSKEIVINITKYDNYIKVDEHRIDNIEKAKSDNMQRCTRLIIGDLIAAIIDFVVDKNF